MKEIAIVLFEGFPLMSMTTITEPLRVANRESSHTLFNWQLVTETGDPVCSSSGIPITPQQSYKSDYVPDVMLVLTSYYPEKSLTAASINYVRHHASRGVLMGCVDTAAFLFAKAGLLKNRKAAVHHEGLKGIYDYYPDSVFMDQLFQFSADFCSSAGGVATLDLTLSLISHFEDRKLANSVAVALNYSPNMTSRAQSSMDHDWSVARFDRKIAKATTIMQENIENPIPLSTIAEACGLQNWQLRRKFRKFFGQAPARYYLDLRLENAKVLLSNSPAAVGDIALRCGFSNMEGFSRAYKKKFSIQPSRDRHY